MYFIFFSAEEAVGGLVIVQALYGQLVGANDDDDDTRVVRWVLFFLLVGHAFIVCLLHA